MDISSVTDLPGEHVQSMRACWSEASICCQTLDRATPGTSAARHGSVPEMVLDALADCDGLTIHVEPPEFARTTGPERTTVPGVIPGPEMTVPMVMVEARVVATEAVSRSVAVLLEGTGTIDQAPVVMVIAAVLAVLTQLYTLLCPKLEFVTLLPIGYVPPTSPPESMLTGTVPAAVVSAADHAE